MTDRPLCVYHANCDDGFAAATVVHLSLHGEVELYPGVYNKPPPDVRERDVIMVDFSYKRPVIVEMLSTCKSMTILDHHKTAAEDLSNLRIVGHTIPFIIFDMKRSGAGLAWDHYFAGKARPLFIDYIEDRDLWRKLLPGGDEFTIALRSYPQTLDVWQRLLAKGPGHLIEEGRPLQLYYRQRVEELKRSSYLAEIKVHGTGETAGLIKWKIKVANAPYFAASEVAGELAEAGDCDFGACYFEARPGEWQYSLRSRGEFDVAAVAKRFGGGGHRNAAGFTVKRPVHEALP